MPMHSISMNGHAIIEIVSNNEICRGKEDLVIRREKMKRRDWKILKSNKWGTYVPHEGDAPYPPYHALD